MLRVVADEEEPPPPKRETLTSRVLSAADNEHVPVRTILVTVLVVVVTGIVLVVIWSLRLELIFLFVAVFFAVLLAGPVDFIERRGLRRSLATTLVFVTFLVAFLGIAFLFGDPLVSHIESFAKELPSLVKKSEKGKGYLGRVITDLHIRSWVVKNAPKLSSYASKLAVPALTIGKAAVSTIIGLVTTAFLTYFLLLDLPKIWEGFLSLLPEERALRVGRVVHEAARGVSGYVLGNAATSLIAGIIVLVTLLILGVPFALLLGLWVALVDLIPIVGTLLAGVPTILVAWVGRSLTAAIVTLIVILVYQQVENHVLNPIIMSKTVRLSKLLILLAVLLFASLGDKVAGVFGTFVGALLGIPLGSAIQVVVREIRRPTPVAREVTGDS